MPQQVKGQFEKKDKPRSHKPTRKDRGLPPKTPPTAHKSNR
jgi:hypothetical protein